MDYNKYKTGEDRLDQMSYYSFKEDDKVEETLLTSIWPGSCQCTHFAHQNKQEKILLEISKKVAKGLLTGASAEMQVQV